MGERFVRWVCLAAGFMTEVKLTIWANGQMQIVPLTAARLTIGRGEQADLQLHEQGLSRLHASLHRNGDQVWVRDEGSTNGSFVNGQRVTTGGTSLQDGDRITLGEESKITVTITHPASGLAASNGKPSTRTPLIAVVIAALFVAGSVISVAVYAWQQHKPLPITQPTPAPVTTATAVPTTRVEAEPAEQFALETAVPFDSTPLAVSPSTGDPISNGRKRYQQMSESERQNYIHEKAQEVAQMIGNRPAVFPPEAITIIKVWLEAYVKRIGNGRTGLWGGDLNRIFERARIRYTPTIVAAFKAHNAPVVVGVYLPFIETEYTNLSSNNRAGAAGLFQFLGGTAKAYGVDPSERTNVEKMAPAAARYINDRMKSFGADAVGVGLSIAGYNRNPISVIRDLHKVINSQNRARDFWVLVQNSDQLDHWFQDENINYVPRFFAAAIIGENPADFGLQMERKLSTYTEIKVTPEEINKPH